MSVLGRMLVSASVVLSACTEPAPLYSANAPPKLAEACKLTLRKCTACHDRDRIVDAQFTAQEWHDTVEQMRRIPGSSITVAERDIILHCLLNRMKTAALATPACFVAAR